MGTADTTSVVDADAPKNGWSSGKSWPFIVIFVAVLIITTGSLLLSLQQGRERRAYEDQQYQSLSDSEPKVTPCPGAESKCELSGTGWRADLYSAIGVQRNLRGFTP